jgi:hypothetical protein
MQVQVFILMDIVLFLWILFAGVIPPAVLGWLMYMYGKKQGEKQYEMAKEDIRVYVKEELLSDIGEAIKNQINGIFGPVAKSGTAATREAAIEYARENPGIANMLLNVASRGGARWLARQFGLTKGQADAIAGIAGGPGNILLHKPDGSSPSQGPEIILPANYQQQPEMNVPGDVPNNLTNLQKVLKQ